MAYPSEYYTKAQEIIDKRRFENSVKAEKRLHEVRSKIPEIVEIDSKLSKTIDELVKIILSDKPDKKQRIEQVKEENLALQERMKELLRKNGYAVDYLDPIYTCRKCHDTGNGDGGRCSCFNDALKTVAAQELSKSLPMGLTCFESFDLSLYSDTVTPGMNTKRSPREMMTQNYEYCKEYAEYFRVPNESIFMTGGTGLGKTHLSLSIAKKVIEKNYSVVYGSVPDLLRRIENAHFNKSEDETEVINTLKECDLLLLLNCTLQRADVIVDGFVAVLAGVEADHAAPQKLRTMASAQVGNFRNQLRRFLFRDEAGRLHGIDQNLQLRDRKAPVFDIIALFPADPAVHDFKALFVEQRNIFVKRPAVAGNTCRIQTIQNFRRCQRVLFVRLLPQQFHKAE